MSFTTDALLGLGVWLVDHGLPVAAGFVGGILAVIASKQWERRKKPNGS